MNITTNEHEISPAFAVSSLYDAAEKSLVDLHGLLNDTLQAADPEYAEDASKELATAGISVEDGSSGPLVSRNDADRLMLIAANVRELLNELIQIAPVSTRQAENHPLWPKKFLGVIRENTNCELCPDPIAEGSSYMASVEIGTSRIVAKAHVDCADVHGFRPGPGQLLNRIKASVGSHRPLAF